MKKNSIDQDLFADMEAGMDSSGRQAQRPSMEPVPAPGLPPRFLPNSHRDDLDTPRPQEKLDSHARLNSRIKELRAHYEQLFFWIHPKS